MSQPEIAGRAPAGVDLEEGSHARRQPFCNGFHAGAGFTPEAFTATKTGRLLFWVCKRTANRPLCDGSHNKLT